MIAVTFCTPQYRHLMDEWERNVQDVGGLEPYGYAVHDLGSWRKNVGQKPQFLLDMLECILKEPFLFVDVDARFRAPWDLSLTDYDFGAYFIDARRMPASDKPMRKYGGVASGTLWVNNTPAVIEFLERWKAAEHGQHRYGQIVLGEVWHTQRPMNLRTFHLPQRYLKVFDRPWHDGEGGGPVVIEHMQASRRLRRKVDSQT